MFGNYCVVKVSNERVVFSAYCKERKFVGLTEATL